ncbi:NAD-dependent succinate-semialdehyde dehydrogenase [Burkholderia ambifaria]|uniref:NAD-dependent succinate-semialdehyde dehydrogenase n=1 Tax=Burkholderia ambifaria TaxID=152480 RepID=UPI001B9F7A6C|nr:NAD-dependent succinate-semialdehyde dehydrogenase [Burkholderia ambifaria]MBR8257223.1 NAD-dependent succinate-semialdehyde dehydrogenase [Burkholderia ambifaria]
MKYEVKLLIGGEWRGPGNDKWQEIVNPADETVIGRVAHAAASDLDAAVAAAKNGFEAWRKTSAVERSTYLRKASVAVRERSEEIAVMLTTEQGKRLAEARAEVLGACEVLEWFAEEVRRIYGSMIPSRDPKLRQYVIHEPIGPVAAFTPWNFPINQAVRKIAAAIAAGCSIVVKGAEETPVALARFVELLTDAGLPEGVLNLVFGIPSEISEHLIASSVIRKVSFTGSTAVGKLLSARAGAQVKRISTELGGHAPVVICDDADLPRAVKLIGIQKFLNAGQACISPTRFLVQRSRYEEVVESFKRVAEGYVLGNGMEASTRMGPLANSRRVTMMEELVEDAIAKGARVVAGGVRPSGAGYFFQPTVLADVTRDTRIFNEEPFGPIAAFAPFDTDEEAIAESNRLPWGLAAYVFTGSSARAERLKNDIESGMVAVNSITLGLPEQHFGGVKESGYACEGGPDALSFYLHTKFVCQAD